MICFSALFIAHSLQQPAQLLLSFSMNSVKWMNTEVDEYSNIASLTTCATDAHSTDAVRGGVRKDQQHQPRFAQPHQLESLPIRIALDP